MIKILGDVPKVNGNIKFSAELRDGSRVECFGRCLTNVTTEEGYADLMIRISSADGLFRESENVFALVDSAKNQGVVADHMTEFWAMIDRLNELCQSETSPS